MVWTPPALEPQGFEPDRKVLASYMYVPMHMYARVMRVCIRVCMCARVCACVCVCEIIIYNYNLNPGVGNEMLHFIFGSVAQPMY